MNILVIGATGGSGRAVCDVLLERGHSVTALARHASRLDARDGLTRVDGDATDRATLDRVLRGQDAVVVTIGISEPTLRVRLRGAQHTPGDVRSRSAEVLIAAARAAGVRRVVVQSSYGVGPTRSLLGALDRALFSLMIKPQIFDSELQESLLRGSELDWTIVQPVYLTDDPSDVHFVTTDGRRRDRKVSRRGVARVHVDLVERGAMVRETVSVSG